jgi:hypothetical protein
MLRNRAAGAADKVSGLGCTFGALAKLGFGVVVLAVVLLPAPASAQFINYVSAIGAGSACTAAAPCGRTAAKASRNIDDMPIAIILLRGLKETYPCEGQRK